MSDGAMLIRRQVESITTGQAKYIKSLRECDVTIVDGLAGTGKTYMAVGVAVHALTSGDSKIKRIVVTRPMVPVDGEEIGFLPGDVDEKAGPWTAPVHESLRKFCLSENEFKEFIDPHRGLVQVCPLALMRGRTFDDTFVILDEAQNSTAKQMEMFLTRMGKKCRVAITGDVTQSDLPPGVPNGLEVCISKLGNRNFTKGKVRVCHLGEEDIVRNDLIAEIIRALHAPDGKNRINGHYLNGRKNGGVK